MVLPLVTHFKKLTKTNLFGKFLISKRHSSWCRCSEEVRHSLIKGEPVVALESTIITHGMPYPHNYEAAEAVENIIREQSNSQSYVGYHAACYGGRFVSFNKGATPATIAVVKGKVIIGLNQEELEELARNQKACLKISRRDFPYAISQKLSGGTTVSGTMVIAHRKGIRVFVTGGIGGVHREGQITLDVSADLTELGKTPVAVVCSGVKSILDIEKTLEYLETQGVAVATYGDSKEFPAFYCKRSGYKSPYNLTSGAEAAKFISTIFNMNLGSGALIAVPIPDKHSLDEKTMDMAIDVGLREARKHNIKGKDVTPFLLNHISQATKGQSLESNIGLIKNNALVGADIAVELSKLTLAGETKSPELGFASSQVDRAKAKGKSEEEIERFRVVVVGGTNLDFVVNVKDENFKTEKSSPEWT